MSKRSVRISAILFSVIFSAVIIAGDVSVTADEGSDTPSETYDPALDDDSNSDDNEENSEDYPKREFVWFRTETRQKERIVNRGMLELVNDFRTGEEAWYRSQDGQKVYAGKLDKLQYNYNLEGLAISRAIESAIYFSHERVNSGKTVAQEGRAQGENLTCGTDLDTYEKAMEDLKETDMDYDGQAHRRNMLGDFKSFAVGHVEINGMHYWAQVFGTEEPPKDQFPGEELAGYDPEESLTVDGYFYSDYLGEITISEPDEPIFIKRGEKILPPYKIVSQLHNKTPEIGQLTSIPLITDTVDYIFTIENTDIAGLTGEKGYVNGKTLYFFDRIEGITNGRTNLIITHPFAGKEYSKKIPLWVVTPVEDLEMETSIKMNPGDKLKLDPKLIPADADRDDLIYKKVKGYVSKTERHYSSSTGKLVEVELVSDYDTVSLTEDGEVEALKNGWIAIDVYSRSMKNQVKRININVGNVGYTETEMDTQTYLDSIGAKTGNEDKADPSAVSESSTAENGETKSENIYSDSAGTDIDNIIAVKEYKARFKSAVSGSKGKIRAVMEKPDIEGVSYQIKYKRAGSGWKYASSEKRKFKIKHLMSKKKYKLKVRIVKTINGQEYFGKWSGVCTIRVK